MLKDFNQFILEARGFSSTVAEYTAVTKALINDQIDQYLTRDFTKDPIDYFKIIRIADAFSEVSQEAAAQFPIDTISVLFRIVPVTPKEFGPYSAYYKKNYNKARIKEGTGMRINITIMCKLFVEFDEEGRLDRDLLNEYLDDILHHELTHALNDYRDPRFLKRHRLGILPDLAIESYDFVNKSKYLRAFLHMLYIFTEAEINAIVGERTEFKTIDEFYEFNATQWALTGRDYDPDEYYEAIKSELYDYETKDPKTGKLQRYWPGIDQRFGEIFVELYRDVQKEEEMEMDPKILKLESTANLQQVLTYFEPYIKSRANELYRKLAKKITQQGEGELD